jgi:hypothetical protein
LDNVAKLYDGIFGTDTDEIIEESSGTYSLVLGLIIKITN